MARLMSENEVEVCERILQALLERPISKLFWYDASDLTNSAVVHPFNLRWVRDRLKSNKFSTPADFVRDLRICLTNGKMASDPGSVRHAAAEQLLLDLDALVQSFQPSAYPAVLPLRFITTDFEKSCGVPEHKEHSTKSDKKPLSMVFTPDTDETDMATLVRDIKFLSSTDLIVKLAVFVRRLQPEGILMDTDIHFNMEILSPDTLTAMRRYVTDLLMAAASGNIDPFARPFGEKVTDIKIQQHGIYMKSSDSM